MSAESRMKVEQATAERDRLRAGIEALVERYSTQLDPARILPALRALLAAHPVQVTTAERREALASLLGDLFEGEVLWADVDAILAARGIVVSDRPEVTP